MALAGMLIGMLACNAVHAQAAQTNKGNRAMKQRKWTLLGRKSRAAGVTLVELMTALSLLGSAAVIGWREVDGYMRSPASISSELEQNRRHESTFVQMEADCAHLVDAQTFEGLPTLTVGQNTLVLLREVGHEGGALFQIVVYRNRDGTLTRASSLPSRDPAQLAADLRAAHAGTDGFVTAVLESNVAVLAMHTWSDGLDWRQDGVEAASPAVETGSSGGPPQRSLQMVAARTGIEVTLQMQGQRTALSKMFFLATG
jgi:general secretion pathway protein J